jgi:A/G-specific adenine glycosylase
MLRFVPERPPPELAPPHPTAHTFAARLFRWHATARRPLVIRDAATPWEILIAEVMSQQTRIERVGPKWRQFVDRWPTPDGLGRASTHELLTAWAGLGYNRRALALREAARSIVRAHGGEVPGSVEGLLGLPGIGPYSARAVAAVAFAVPVAPLDVNVRRVVTRVLGPAVPAAGLQAAADRLVSRRDPARWVHAVMDLGAAMCGRTAPDCPRCPLAPVCRSRGTVGDGPMMPSQPRFGSTRRWLRGRLLTLAAERVEGTWLALPERLGEHDAEAIRTAASALCREGFIEVRDDHVRLVPDGGRG